MAEKKTAQTPIIKTSPIQNTPQVISIAHQESQAPPPPPPPIDEFDGMVEKYRPRLMGVFIQTNQSPKVYIQILDSSFHIKDTYTSEELILMGWKISLMGRTMVQVQKNDKNHLIRNWPIDPFGKVSESVSESSAVTGS